MFTNETLAALKQAEETLVFDHFDFADAYALGTRLHAAGEAAEKPISVRIRLGELIVYQSFLPGTDEENCRWMDRKSATVSYTGKSSLRAAVERALFGACEPWQQDEEKYAFSGGGFPLIVSGKMVGVAVVSGLPHLEDHRLVTGCIAEYLGKSPISVPIAPDH